MRRPVRLIPLLMLAMVGATSAAAAEQPYQADPVVIEAERERELLYLILHQAMQGRRSDAQEDAHRVVCRKSPRPGSLTIMQTRCATNQTWLEERQTVLRANAAALADSLLAAAMVYAAASAPYPVRSEPSWMLSSAELARLAKDYGDDPHPGRLAAMLAAHDAHAVGDESATPLAEVQRFAAALAAVAQSPADADEETLVSQIQAAGVTLARYNELVERLESSPRFRSRVAAERALLATAH